MNIKMATKKDLDQVAALIAQFRLEHKLIKGIKSTLNVNQAKIEFIEYLESDFPIYLATDDEERVLGYIVCRVDDDVVWVESIFIIEAERRNGIALSLYQKAEELVTDLGGDTLYNWVLPNNDKIINFLSKQGYDVLNMIEIRKPHKSETLSNRIHVGDHQYLY
ncbi:MAG: GNAT family N-acetyltransferase [Clostridiales bacterium]|nr:GNAT family N-acetyltransferase [Clostridiales bacterium]